MRRSGERTPDQRSIWSHLLHERMGTCADCKHWSFIRCRAVNSRPKGTISGGNRALSLKRIVQPAGSRLSPHSCKLGPDAVRSDSCRSGVGRRVLPPPGARSERCFSFNSIRFCQVPTWSNTSLPPPLTSPPLPLSMQPPPPPAAHPPGTTPGRQPGGEKRYCNRPIVDSAIPPAVAR